MKIKVKSIYFGEELIEIDKIFETDEHGKILDKNGNGYRTVKFVGKATKIELAQSLSPWTYSADEFPTTAFLQKEGTNAILRFQNGGIKEAIVEVLENDVYSNKTN